MRYTELNIKRLFLFLSRSIFWYKSAKLVVHHTPRAVHPVSTLLRIMNIHIYVYTIYSLRQQQQPVTRYGPGKRFLAYRFSRALYAGAIHPTRARRRRWWGRCRERSVPGEVLAEGVRWQRENKDRVSGRKEN